MNQKKLTSVLVALLLGAVGVVLAETDYIAMPILQDIQKGTDNGNQIQSLRVQGTATVASNATSYGYNVLVSSNKSTAVYMVQGFSSTSYPGYTPTNTFAITFIEAPKVAVIYTAATTNATQLYVSSVASNAIIVTAATNYSGMAIGRVK